MISGSLKLSFVWEEPGELIMLSTCYMPNTSHTLSLLIPVAILWKDLSMMPMSFSTHV